MLFLDLSIYAKIILFLLGLLAIFSWVTIPAIAIYQFFHVMRMPKATLVGAKVGVVVIEKLGLTISDGGEPPYKKKNQSVGRCKWDYSVRLASLYTRHAKLYGFFVPINSICSRIK